MELSKNPKRSLIAPQCPCGKSNDDNKFVPCVDDPNAGYCHSCDKTFFLKNNGLYHNNTEKKAKIQPPKDKILQYFSDFTSPFHVFANSFLDVDLKNEFEKWKIGTFIDKKDYKKTVFGITNPANDVIGLKYIQYQTNGKRDKKQFPYYEKDCERCLFGLHLYEKNKKKPCILVESEKTAFLSAMYLQSEYNFLATGGATGLKEEMIYPLLGNEVYYFCDNDQAGKSNKSIEILKKFARKQDIKLKIIDVFSDKEKGFDLADYLVECGKSRNIDLFAKKIKDYINDKPYFVEIVNEIKATKTEESEEKTKKNEKTEKMHFGEFYVYDKRKDDLKIDVGKFINILKSLGFARFDDQTAHSYIKIDKNIVKHITNLAHIRDCFDDWLIENHNDTEVSYQAIHNKVINTTNHIFGEHVLSRLRLEKPLNFKKDTYNESYIFYQNTVIVIDKKGFYQKKYSELDFFVWDDLIVKRDFVYTQDKGQYQRFCELVSNADKNPKHFESLKTIIGYLLHDYKEGQRKAINFTDCALERGKEGRSGKSLFAKSLGHIRNLTDISGKSFNPENPRKYDQAQKNTQIIHLNDLKKDFQLESIYNDITDNLEIRHIYSNPFYISPKIILSSNRPLLLNTGSDRDRVIEFEFSNYFSEHYTPFEEFGGKGILNNGWENTEWQMFDSFIVDCLKLYFEVGILTPENTLLNKRKIIYELGEFVGFCEGYEHNTEYDKDVEIQRYLRFSGENLTLTKFTQYLKKYANLSGLEYTERRERSKGSDKTFFKISDKNAQKH